jgi:hypothetical protein
VVKTILLSKSSRMLVVCDTFLSKAHHGEGHVTEEAVCGGQALPVLGARLTAVPRQRRRPRPGRRPAGPQTCR